MLREKWGVEGRGVGGGRRGGFIKDAGPARCPDPWAEEAGIALSTRQGGRKTSEDYEEILRFASFRPFELLKFSS